DDRADAVLIGNKDSVSRRRPDCDSSHGERAASQAGAVVPKVQGSTKYCHAPTPIRGQGECLNGLIELGDRSSTARKQMWKAALSQPQRAPVARVRRQRVDLRAQGEHARAIAPARHRDGSRGASAVAERDNLTAWQPGRRRRGTWNLHSPIWT